MTLQTDVFDAFWSENRKICWFQSNILRTIFQLLPYVKVIYKHKILRVAKWQRIEHFTPGMYAISVNGRLPNSIVREIKNSGVHYRSRDNSVKMRDVWKPKSANYCVFSSCQDNYSGWPIKLKEINKHLNLKYFWITAHNSWTAASNFYRTTLSMSQTVYSMTSNLEA